MSVKTIACGDSGSTEQDLPVPHPNWEAGPRLDRLKAAVKAAGGNAVVAKKSGVPLGSLNNYFGGREMKVPAMIALADACGVTVEWLAAGRGPMHAGDAPPQQHPAATTRAGELAVLRNLDVDYFRDAINMVEAEAAAENITLNRDEKAALVAEMYDQMMLGIARIHESLSNLHAAFPSLSKDIK